MVSLTSVGRQYPVRRMRSGSPIKSKKSPILWIGISMFCLVLVYAGVVITFAVYHKPQQVDLKRQPKEPTSPGNARKPFKETLQEARERKEVPKVDGNPVRKHHLELELGAGVDPMHLVSHKEAPIMMTSDGPQEDHPTPNNVLTAYMEPLNYDDWEMHPLPVRTATSNDLSSVQYTRLNSCSRMSQQWPMDDPPTERDPFLPWIHDVFPTADGKYMQIVAQNMRRCKTGSQEKDVLHHMAPQAALFQHISVKRLETDGETRYRLASHEDADSDAVATRFICRFKPSMEETLSEFNFDYEWASVRKKYKKGFQKDYGGIQQMHTTQLVFRCPVPESLQETVRSGSSVHEDWASLFFDLIPIRTAPRWGSPARYPLPKYSDFVDKEDPFDPLREWGTEHVLPRIQDSGRWENIPICKPSLMTYENAVESVSVESPKKYRLASCLWASSGYTTRGNRFAVNDGQRRLLEWIQHNSMIGFDHFYIYDNSGAFGTESSLKGIADLMPDKVTYIPWPAKICNNNPNNVDSPGERSSQYAAESSCRLRFGPHVDWIGQFDIDEYLIPMGNHTQVTAILDQLEKEDTRIISFKSWRAWPRQGLISPPEPINDPGTCWSKQPCFQLTVPLNTTMLQAYNCDRQKPGEKKSEMPAEKQLYRTDYVLQHFVHFSTVTELSEKNQTEYEKEGFRWKGRSFPDPRQRFADEVQEGLMIHTKAVARQDTAGWEKACHISNLAKPKKQQAMCRLGVPWPNGDDTGDNATADGWAYNCYVNEKVENHFVPALQEKLNAYKHYFDAT